MKCLTYKSNKIHIVSMCRKITKCWWKEIKGYLNKWRSIPCSWIGRINTVKMPVFPILICRCDSIPIKIPANYFGDIDKLILTFMCRGKRPRIPTQYWRKQSWRTGATISKTYYKATIIKIVRYCKKNRRTDQWNRQDWHKYTQLILDKGAKLKQWSNNNLFNQWCWYIWIATCRRVNWTSTSLHL